MNPSSVPELSLYERIQQVDPIYQPLIVSGATFKSAIASFIDLLVDKQISATLWVKLPRKKYWLGEIDRYQQQGNPEQIYLCSTRITEALPLESESSIVPIGLEAIPQLKQEYFFIVLSSQICGLILAQKQSDLEDSESQETESRSPVLKMMYSFDASVIANVLAGIKQAISINDTIPQELLDDVPISFGDPVSSDLNLFSYLLTKQIEKAQENSLDTATLNVTQLNESLKFKDQFMANLAREIRVPLTNMKTALSLLESANLKREQRDRYLGLLQREWHRQNKLLASVLEFVQCDQITESELEASIKLQDLIPGIVSTYQPIAEEKGILLGYTIPGSLPSVCCPSNWLREILVNLLNNSLKFTSPNGRINVKADHQNQYIELTVSDTGIGIERSELPKIFDSFYRGRNTTNSDETGAGLGLTIVKYLINRCSGSILVNSQLGKGSIFRVLLPIARS